ncbi:amidase family protein, partial [Escherichia coli]|nr:amidase family protein [Escherichia coli]
AERLNEKLNCFLSVESEHALERVEILSRNTSPLPLAGTPVAIKDNICTKGLQTTCGSRILANYRAHYDATAVQRLNEAGA